MGLSLRFSRRWGAAAFNALVRVGKAVCHEGADSFLYLGARDRLAEINRSIEEAEELLRELAPGKRLDFNQSTKAVQAQKIALAQEMRDLKRQRKSILKRFPELDPSQPEAYIL